MMVRKSQLLKSPPLMVALLSIVLFREAPDSWGVIRVAEVKSASSRIAAVPLKFVDVSPLNFAPLRWALVKIVSTIIAFLKEASLRLHLVKSARVRLH